VHVLVHKGYTSLRALLTERGAAQAGSDAADADWRRSDEARTSASGPLDPEAVVSVLGLRKAYGGFEAVRGVDLDVRRGEVFAFLGPNGAGKTTTVEILEGNRRRSGGEVQVLGVDPARGRRGWRDRLGVVLQESQPEPYLTVGECLELYAVQRPRRRAAPLLVGAACGVRMTCAGTNVEAAGRAVGAPRIRFRLIGSSCASKNVAVMSVRGRVESVLWRRVRAAGEGGSCGAA
jgi:hypothetical protein